MTIVLWLLSWLCSSIFLIAMLALSDRKKYVVVEEKGIQYFESWTELVAHIKTAESVDVAYEFKIFVKDKNKYTYVSNRID